MASFCDQVPVVGGRAGSMVRAGPVGSGQTVRAAALELLVQGGRSGGALLLHQLHHDRLHSLGGLEIQNVAVSGRILQGYRPGPVQPFSIYSQLIRHFMP